MVEYEAGSRYADGTPMLLDLQAPTGMPRSALLDSVTDPISPTPRAADRLAHFFEGVYDLSPESHLSKLLKVILGDAGIGILSKQYTAARLQSIILTTRYGDLDRIYGALLGMRRMASEMLGSSPYVEDATPDEWDVIDARDAGYRSRVETFSRAIALGPTPAGMAALAQAVTGVECRVHEAYLDIDEGTLAVEPPTQPRTYGGVEQDFRYYGAMRGSYADIEGGAAAYGGSLDSNRALFTVTPTRALTLEETYELTRVLNRFKPAGALLKVSPHGVEIHRPVKVRHAYADSVYWEVSTKVAPKKDVEAAYLRTSGAGVPTVQPRPVFAAYQGEAWSYNKDVSQVLSYTLDDAGEVRDQYNYERVTSGRTSVDYTPSKAIADPTRILLGRAASDAVLTSSPYPAERTGAFS